MSTPAPSEDTVLFREVKEYKDEFNLTNRSTDPLLTVFRASDTGIIVLEHLSRYTIRGISCCLHKPTSAEDYTYSRIQHLLVLVECVGRAQSTLRGTLPLIVHRIASMKHLETKRGRISLSEQKSISVALRMFLCRPTGRDQFNQIFPWSHRC